MEQIRELAKVGWNADIPPMLLPMNGFTDVLNVRFDDESVQTITGETTYVVMPRAVDHGIHWQRPDQSYNIFLKDQYAYRVNAAGTIGTMNTFTADATNTYSSSKWQSTLFNGGYAVIINNGKSVPKYCLYGGGTADTQFVDLPNWNYVSGLTVYAKLIRSLNYSLVAANLTIDNSGITTYSPGTIRISVQSATGGVPDIWQPGLTTDTADEFELSSTSPIIDMMELRGNMFIYSQDCINILTIGATTRVSPYSKSYGVMNVDCVCEYNGNHFVVDDNDIYTHNGSGNIQSVVDFRTKRYFFDNLNRSYSHLVHVTRDTYKKEIWVNYPKGSSTVCNEALIYSYNNNTWTRRVLPGIKYSFSGPIPISGSFSYTKNYVYLLPDSTQTLVTNDGYLMWSGSALAGYTSYVERKKLNTGDIPGSILISSFYPVFDKVPTNASITIKVVGQNNYIKDTDLSTVDGDTFTFLPDNEKSQGYKVDPRTNGRVLNYRISSTDYWRLALFAIDARPADRR